MGQITGHSFFLRLLAQQGLNAGLSAVLRKFSTSSMRALNGTNLFLRLIHTLIACVIRLHFIGALICELDVLCFNLLPLAMIWKHLNSDSSERFNSLWHQCKLNTRLLLALIPDNNNSDDGCLWRGMTVIR